VQEKESQKWKTTNPAVKELLKVKPAIEEILPSFGFPNRSRNPSLMKYFAGCARYSKNFTSMKKG